jgi:hypothetical protein
VDQTSARRVTNPQGRLRALPTARSREKIPCAAHFEQSKSPPLEAADLEAVLATAIVENAHYRRAVDDTELARAEHTMGLRFPGEWRAYLQRDVWFHRAWMGAGDYVWLYEPAGTADVWKIWHDLGLDDRPGMLAIGSDGGPELITIDARDPKSPVTCTGNVSQGRQDAIAQTDSIEAFITAIESGTFAYLFE